MKFGNFDKTESGFKIVGLVGTALAGLSAVAVNTWKILKEKDKFDEDKAKKKAAESKTNEEPAKSN